jgi:hypothetical protein
MIYSGPAPVMCARTPYACLESRRPPSARAASDRPAPRRWRFVPTREGRGDGRWSQSAPKTPRNWRHWRSRGGSSRWYGRWGGGRGGEEERGRERERPREEGRESSRRGKEDSPSLSSALRLHTRTHTVRFPPQKHFTHIKTKMALSLKSNAMVRVQAARPAGAFCLKEEEESLPSLLFSSSPLASSAVLGRPNARRARSAAAAGDQSHSRTDRAGRVLSIREHAAQLRELFLPPPLSALQLTLSPPPFRLPLAPVATRTPNQHPKQTHSCPPRGRPQGCGRARQVREARGRSSFCC